MTPLTNKRILDLTQLLPGPYATQLLVELGAEVIKIEPPDGDPMRFMPPLLQDGNSARFAALNRGKKSVSLNLKEEADLHQFLELAKSADAVIEGFRPGVVQRLGLDYESLKAINFGIVYCSLTGYGQQGPYRGHVGHDINYVGMAGLLSVTGFERPMIPGVPVADLSGGMFAALTLMAALWQREKTGEGRYLDVSMTDSVLSWMTFHLAEHAATQSPPVPWLTGGYPFYNAYETQEGGWITVGCLEPKFWERLCLALNLPEFVPHQFATGDQQALIFKILKERFRQKTLQQWLDELDATQIPIAPVYDLDSLRADPQLNARGCFQSWPAALWPLQRRSFEHDKEAPALGQHNAEFLS